MACLNSHVLVYQASDPFQSAIWEKPLLTIHRLLLLHPCVLWLRNNFRLAQLPPWCGLFNVHNCGFLFLTSDNSEHVCPWLILHISWIFNFRSNYHEKKKKNWGTEVTAVNWITVVVVTFYNFPQWCLFKLLLSLPTVQNKSTSSAVNV